MGLVEEVRKLLDMGYKPDSTALQGLGYKEIIYYLKNELSLRRLFTFLKEIPGIMPKDKLHGSKQ